MCVFVCVCVCVTEREGERGIERERRRPIKSREFMYVGWESKIHLIQCFRVMKNLMVDTADEGVKLITVLDGHLSVCVCVCVCVCV